MLISIRHLAYAYAEWRMEQKDESLEADGETFARITETCGEAGWSQSRRDRSLGLSNETVGRADDTRGRTEPILGGASQTPGGPAETRVRMFESLAAVVTSAGRGGGAIAARCLPS